jgi:electron transfer flavoprotein alpha/beta subunit
VKVLALIGRGSALPCALQLGDTCALGLFPPGKEGPLKAARAAGAARAVALWDEELHATDFLGVAQVLAAAARHLGFDVLVAGEASRAAVGPALADRLGVPHLTGVIDARLDAERVVARRMAGQVRRYRAAPPLVLSVVGGTPLAAADAAGAPVERLELAAVGLSGPELRWRKRYLPHPSEGPRALPRDFADASALAARLAGEGLLAARGGRR